MKVTLTNKMNLPQSIVNAVTNDPYTRGASDISVTALITPPYQRKLKETVEQVEDVSDRIWSLVGQATHTILERAHEEDENIRVEERLFTDCNGWVVSGQFDVIQDDCLMDYKITSVWSVMGDTKVEWEQQLNLLRLLAIRNGIKVERLRIIAILRDWSKGKAMQADYPAVQVVPIEIPVWPIEQAEAFMLERVRAHQASDPPPCTAEERWATPEKFALMKKGRKTAVKLYDSEREAAQASRDSQDMYVVHRPGQYRRCADYCSVAHGCPQYQREVAF
jgi:hypothetical protein